MGERVIGFPESEARGLSAAQRLRPATPGADDGLRWAKITDQDLAPALSKKERPSLLYFSVEDYEHAVRGLSPEETLAAVRLRMSYFPAAAVGQSTDFVFRRARRALVLAAASAERGVGPVVPALEGYFGALLDLLARQAGQGRFDDLDAATMLEYAAEGEASLLAEAASLGPRFGAAAGRTFEDLDESRDFLDAYARMLASLGRPEYSEAPPYIEHSRGVLFVGAQKDLAEKYRAMCIPAVAVPGGVIAPVKDREMEDAAPDRLLLYFTTGDFVGALAGLTVPQIERDLRERRSAMENAPGPLVRDYHAGARLQQALLRRSLLATLAREVPAFVQDVEVHVARDERTLRRALAHLRPFLAADPPDPFAALAEEHRRLAEDAAFFAELARSAGEDVLRAKHTGMLLEIEAQRRAVPGL